MQCKQNQKGLKIWITKIKINFYQYLYVFCCDIFEKGAKNVVK